MSEIIATIQTSDNLIVSTVGIQGPSGASTTVETISNVDAINPVNGSLLIYKTTTNKWTASTTLDAQNMEGGEF
jgi:hypothetical protein